MSVLNPTGAPLPNADGSTTLTYYLRGVSEAQNAQDAQDTVSSFCRSGLASIQKKAVVAFLRYTNRFDIQYRTYESATVAQQDQTKALASSGSWQGWADKYFGTDALVRLATGVIRVTPAGYTLDAAIWVTQNGKAAVESVVNAAKDAFNSAKEATEKAANKVYMTIFWWVLIIGIAWVVAREGFQSFNRRQIAEMTRG